MAKKALIAVTSHDQLGTLRKTGYYLPEVAHPFLVLHDAGYDVDRQSLAGPAGARRGGPRRRPIALRLPARTRAEGSPVALGATRSRR